MKKLLLFLLVIISSCTNVGYIATIEVRQADKIDTIRVPYQVNQSSPGGTYGPYLGLKYGMLSERQMLIYTGVESFSVLSIEKLKDN